MKQTTKSTGHGAASTSVHNIEPKTLIAAVLVAMMLVLWGRVLLKSKTGPASAEAATTAVDKTSPENAGAELRIRVLPLKFIAGRHDRITSDYFRADQSSIWKTAESSPRPTSRIDENQRKLDELARSVALEAIIKDGRGVAQKACINGAIVAVGSFMDIQVRNEKYRVRITMIEPDRVHLSWQDQSIAVEIPDQKVSR